MTQKYPGYTSHGHPIPGAVGIAGQRPKYIARCGGPRLCGTCSLEAERYNEPRPDGNEPPKMADQTPSTEDVLTSDEMRRAFIAYREHVHAYTPDEAANEWDAWLAAHDREVAAKALREAADAWRAGTWANAPRHNDPARDRIAAAKYAGEWLDARADRIGAGDE